MINPSFSLTRRFIFILTGVLAFSIRPALAVDNAIVVGVDHYPALTDAAGRHPDLAGCINDAREMGQSLKSYGFEVKLLADAKKSDIVGAIKACASSDRFVFYFAGNGTRASNLDTSILPADAQENSEKNDLTASEMNALVRGVAAKSRTILIDSSFSAGMPSAFERQKLVRRTLSARFYRRQSALQKTGAVENGAVENGAVENGVPRGEKMRGSKDLEPNRADDTSSLEGNVVRPAAIASTEKAENQIEVKRDDAVCYFVAARANQIAAEDDFGGARHGVFTHFLTQRLNGERPRWGDLQAKVGGDVSDYMNSEQQPTLTPAFADKTVFEGNASVSQPLRLDNVWDVFNGDSVDRANLELAMKPNLTNVPLNNTLSFQIAVGREGYLVLLEKGTSGNINLMFPRQVTTEAARVEAGSLFRIPDESHIYRAKDAGSERIKAILFTDKNLVEALLKVFQNGNRTQRSLSPQAFKKKARDLQLEDDVARPFYTSDLTFEVVP